MKYALLIGLLLLGCATMPERRARDDAALDRVVGPRAMPADTADVKTCGCKKNAACGDCCGKDHCRCSPN